MISSFVLMGALVPLVFVNGDYSDDEESAPEYYYDEDAVDLYNNNGNIQVQTGSCFCDTGCYANEWRTLKCCDVRVLELTFHLYDVKSKGCT